MHVAAAKPGCLTENLSRHFFEIDALGDGSMVGRWVAVTESSARKWTQTAAAHGS